MAKVWSTDLTNANISSSMKLLGKIPYDAQEIGSKIESFIEEIGEGKPLSGDGYTAVKTKFELYIDSLKKLGQICSILKEDIWTANYYLLTFMDGFTFLDDARKSEFENLRDEAEADWTYAKNATYENDAGIQVNLYSPNDIARFEAEYWRLFRYVEKLKKLSEEDANAYSYISGIEGSISSFISEINGISNNSFSVMGKTFDEINFTPLLISHNGVYKRKLNNGNTLIGYDQTDDTWDLSNYDAPDASCAVVASCVAAATVRGDDNIIPDNVATLCQTYSSGNNTSNVPLKVASASGIDYSDKINPFAEAQQDLEFINYVLEKGGAAVVNPNNHFIAIVDHDPNTNLYTIWDPFYLDRNSNQYTFNEIINEGGGVSCFVYGPIDKKTGSAVSLDTLADNFIEETGHTILAKDGGEKLYSGMRFEDPAVTNALIDPDKDLDVAGKTDK